MSRAPVPDRLRAARQLGSCKDRVFCRVSRVAPEIVIVPFNHDFQTLERAVKERVFFVKSKDGFVPPPRPSKGVFESRLATTLEQLRPLLPSTTPWTHDEFLESCKGRKKLVYQQALESLRLDPSITQRDADVKVFVKFEKTDFTSKSDPVPRVISPRSPRFNFAIGRYLKKLEHMLFKSIDRLYGDATVVKGYDALTTASILKTKWDSFRRPVAIGLDASRFDQHVSIDALGWEHSVYLKCFPLSKHRRKLNHLLRFQLHNRCFGNAPDGKLSYTIDGTRMSGDMNTSLGNCLLMCSMVHAYAIHCGVDLKLANNGDDCVVFMEQNDLSKFNAGLQDWFLDMGFNMVVEDPVYQFEKVEFCQTHPVFDGSTFLMVRNPRTAIAKDSVMLHPWHSSSLFKGWLDAVGVGGLAMTGAIPVFQEFYNLYVKSGESRPIPKELLSWSFRHMSAGMTRTYSSVQESARASFYWAFGVTPDEQIVLEKYYASMTISSVPGLYEAREDFP